jgi:hypothetical protein
MRSSDCVSESIFSGEIAVAADVTEWRQFAKFATANEHHCNYGRTRTLFVGRCGMQNEDVKK